MKKMTKKFLSLLLSALLIVSSLPLFAFTALAAGIDDLNNAITAYEDKMDGTVYTNMKAAYDEYIDALAAKDAYLYGGDTTVDLAAAASALTAASDAMNPWSRATFNADAYYYGNVATGGYANVVYCSNASSNTLSSGKQNKAYMYNYFYAVNNIVVAYDGETTPRIPAAYVQKCESSHSNRIYYVAATSITNFKLNGNWYGSTDAKVNGSVVYTGLPWNTSSSRSISSTVQTSPYNSDCTNTGTPRIYSNSLAYTGSGNTTNYYELVNSLTYRFCGYYSYWGSNTQTIDYTFSPHYYVINYKPIIEDINNVKDTLSTACTSGVENYTEGGLASLLTYLDLHTADSANPNTYTYSSNMATSVTNCATAIKTAATASYTAPSQDGNGYSNLRSAINRTKATYDATNDSGSYTADSWAAFATAYEAAVNTMKAQPTDEYNNDSDAAAKATALNNAYDALETVATKVDTTPVTSLVDTYRSWNTIFTAETAAAVEAAIDAASQAIWNGNYGVAGDALNDSDEARATVETHRAAIAAAIKNLRISPDAIAQSDNMKLSMNQALALDVDTPSDYSNYSSLTNAKNAAQLYMTQAASTDFTDYDTQYAEYIAYVQAIYDAFNGLLPSFLKIPDGDAAQNTAQTNMTQLTTSDQGQQIVQFGYTNYALIMKMNHDGTTVPFGVADILFATNIESKVNNMLDSISINATADTIGGNGQKNHIRDLSTWTSTPYALSDTEKTTYAGCLTYNEFSVSDIRYLGANANKPEQFATDNSGNVISFEDGATTDFTPILGTTDGAATNPGTGGIFARSTGSTASVLLEGNFNLDIPSSTAAGVESNNGNEVVKTTYTMNNTYFGAVTLYNCQNVSNCAGYDWYTSKTNNEKINISVDVVDAANLVDLIYAANDILSTESLYTKASWEEFTAALEAAQTDIDYTTLSANEIQSQLQTRYDNLWREWKDATDGLQLAANNQSLKDARVYSTDAKDNKTVDALYNEGNANEYWDTTLWAAFEAAYEAVTGTNGLGNKYSDINIRNYGTSEQPTIDGLADALKAAYDALEIGGILVDPAVELVYGEDGLAAKLDDYKFYASDLETMANTLADLEYYTDTIGTYIPKENQTAFDAEVAALEALNAIEPAGDFDKDAFQQYINTAKARANDPDAYNIDEVVSYIAEMEDGASRSVTVLGTSYEGLASDAMQRVDNAYQKLESMDIQSYAVTVDNAAATITDASGKTYASGDKIPYGTTVTVSTGDKAAYTYDYVSNTSNKNGGHIQKYVGTLEEFTFTVAGTTNIIAAAPNGDNTYKVSYITSCKSGDEELLGYTTYVEYVSAGTTVNATKVKAPSYAFYSFQGYSETSATINADTKIYLNYTIVSNEPMCTVYNFDEGSETSYHYGEIVTESLDESAVAVAKVASEDLANYLYEGIYNDYPNYPFKDDSEDLIDTVDPFLTVVAYGNTYTFKITEESVYLVSILSTDEILVCAEPVYDNVGAPSSVYVSTHATVNEDTIITNSSFAMPEGYELVEAGVLVQYNKTGEALVDREINFDTVGDDQGNDKIRRLKSTKLDNGTDNSYTINLHLNSATGRAKYIAYINYTDDQGAMHTVFSAAQDAVIG